MKVLFISRATLYKVKGGDTVQIENTAAGLRTFGVDVEIALCNNLDIDYSGYDLIHFFNIIRPADIIYHVDKSGLPFVVSPIYVEYTEQARYNRNNFKDKVLAMLGKHTQEYVKCLARSVINKEKIVSRKYLFLGHSRSIRYILTRCSHLLPNSQSEYLRLKRDFRAAGTYSIVPNAVDINRFTITAEELLSKQDKTVLCVARFEPQKNQLNIIRALAGTGYRLTLAGSVAPNHRYYYHQCKALAGSNVTFLDFIPHEKVADLYKQHKVHILASWFETTGLSSLEAAACGCNIVISNKGDTIAYFSDYAYYCDPADPDTIKAAVDNAMNAEEPKAFRAEIKERYNWAVAAKETLAVYQKVLNV
jgi:glycosyltransferase involved in cell wall biosynthesis